MAYSYSEQRDKIYLQKLQEKTLCAKAPECHKLHWDIRDVSRGDIKSKIVSQVLK